MEEAGTKWVWEILLFVTCIVSHLFPFLWRKEQQCAFIPLDQMSRKSLSFRTFILQKKEPVSAYNLPSPTLLTFPAKQNQNMVWLHWCSSWRLFVFQTSDKEHHFNYINQCQLGSRNAISKHQINNEKRIYGRLKGDDRGWSFNIDQPDLIRERANLEVWPTPNVYGKTE